MKTQQTSTWSWGNGSLKRSSGGGRRACTRKAETCPAWQGFEYLLASGSGEDDVIAGSTALYITPGYEFRATDKLITNFHQAESTLMLLVAFPRPKRRGAGVG